MNKIIPIILISTISLIGCKNEVASVSHCELDKNSYIYDMESSVVLLQNVLSVANQNPWLPQDVVNTYEIQDEIIERLNLINSAYKTKNESFTKNCTLWDKSFTNMKESDKQNKAIYQSIFQIDDNKENIMEYSSCQTEAECELILGDEFKTILEDKKSNEKEECTLTKELAIEEIDKINNNLLNEKEISLISQQEHEELKKIKTKLEKLNNFDYSVECKHIEIKIEDIKK